MELTHEDSDGWHGAVVGKVIYHPDTRKLEIVHLDELPKKEIEVVCSHRWFRTTKNYKRAWKCLDCRKVTYDKNSEV